GQIQAKCTTASFKAAWYLAEVIKQTLDTSTVPKAKAVMDWLQDLVQLAMGHLSNGEATPVIWWRTPVGFQAVQDYRVQKTTRVDITTFHVKLPLRRSSITEPTSEPDRKAHISGIAPNVVHSLDASAMMLTVVAAKREGITHFLANHD